MTTCITRTEASQYVIDCLGEYAKDYDIDAIVDEAFERTDDGWTIEEPSDEFWGIVRANDISDR